MDGQGNRIHGNTFAISHDAYLNLTKDFKNFQESFDKMSNKVIECENKLAALTKKETKPGSESLENKVERM